MNIKACLVSVAALMAATVTVALPNSAQAAGFSAPSEMTISMVEGGTATIYAFPGGLGTDGHQIDIIPTAPCTVNAIQRGSTWNSAAGYCDIHGSTDGLLFVQGFSPKAGALPNFDVSYSATDVTTGVTLCAKCVAHILVQHYQPLRVTRINKHTLRVQNPNEYSVDPNSATFLVTNNRPTSASTVVTTLVPPKSAVRVHLVGSLDGLRNKALAWSGRSSSPNNVLLNQHGRSLMAQ